MEKVQLRKSMIGKRNGIPEPVRREKSLVIEKEFLSSLFYKNAKDILIYLDMGSEVATRGIIRRALSDGKKVGIPYAVPKSRIMHFIEITNLDDLVKSTYGAYEPVFREDKIMQCHDKTLIIVPGCAFDTHGYRLGYGGGYYDTYIADHVSYKNIAIAYEEQLVDKVPVESHDKKLDGLITDREVFVWKL